MAFTSDKGARKVENTKTLMAQFYSRCQENGYTDMTDAIQSLKAKMIAMELKLDYKDIVAFYQEAKHCHEQVSAEQKRLEEERRIQQQKDDEEAVRRAVDGQLLASLYDIGHNSKSQISVYQRPDKSIYYTIGNGQRNEGVPEISVHKSGSLQYTYHPSQAVYTGATVGGVTTGGVHHTKASLSERVDRSNKGYFEVKAQDTSFEVNRVELSDYTCNRFARDTSFARYVENKKIVCYDPSVKSSLLTYAANPTSSLSYYDRLSIGSMALDERRLPFDTSAALARLVGQIIHAQFPPTDEEYYNKAAELAKKETSTELKQAVDLFMHIRDYRDAAEQAVFANDRYQEILQKEEKEAAQEAAERLRKIKKILKIAIPAATLCIAIIVLLNTVIIPNNKHKKAVALMDAENYESAIPILTTLEDFADSKILLQYSTARCLYNNKQYSDAKLAFENMSGYRDSDELIIDCIYHLAHEAHVSGEYNTAKEMFESLNGYKDSVDMAIESMYMQACSIYDMKEYQDAKDIFEQLGDYKDSSDKLVWCDYGLTYASAQNYEKTNIHLAYDEYSKLPADYPGVADRINLLERLMDWEGEYETSYYFKPLEKQYEHTLTISFSIEDNKIYVNGLHTGYVPDYKMHDELILSDQLDQAEVTFRSGGNSEYTHLYFYENSIVQYYNKHYNYTFYKADD